jgi:hypothetical protein
MDSDSDPSEDSLGSPVLVSDDAEDGDETVEDGDKSRKKIKEEKKLVEWEHSLAKGVLFGDLEAKRIPLVWKRGDLTFREIFDQYYKDVPSSRSLILEAWTNFKAGFLGSIHRCKKV